MFLGSSLRGMRRRFSAWRGKVGRSGEAQRRLRRPALEGLEDRALPSTFTVLNLLDGGPGSLRQAILEANANPGHDLVRFAPSVEGTITLSGGELSITDDLRIEGRGAGRLAVSGDEQSRVFRIAGGVTASIDRLTVTRGLAENGGGIWNAGGSLSLTRVVVSGNQAVGAPGADAFGGGVLNEGGILTVSHSTFADNQAVGGAGDPRGPATARPPIRLARICWSVFASFFVSDALLGHRRASATVVGHSRTCLLFFSCNRRTSRIGYEVVQIDPFRFRRLDVRLP